MNKKIRVLHPVETIWSMTLARSVDSRGVFRIAICLETPLGRKLHEFRDVPALETRDQEIVDALGDIVEATPWYERPDLIRVDEQSLGVLMQESYALRDIEIEIQSMSRIRKRSQKAFEKVVKEEPRYDRQTRSALRQSQIAG